MNHPLIAKALSGDKRYSAQWSVYENNILLQVWEKGQARQDAFLTLEDFAHVHPMLPGALWASMARELGNKGREACYDEELRGTLALLRGEAVFFEDADGQSCRMYDLENIDLNHDALVNVTGTVITIETANYGTQKFQCATTATKCTIQVEPEELTRLYPDWDRRMVVAQGLSLEPVELVKFVFSVVHTPVADSHLTGVSFE